MEEVEGEYWWIGGRVVLGGIHCWRKGSCVGGYSLLSEVIANARLLDGSDRSVPGQRRRASLGR